MHYSAVFIHAIDQKLIVSKEKQLNLSLRATYLRQKIESFQDIKFSRNIFALNLFLQVKRLQYFWKKKENISRRLPENSRNSFVDLQSQIKQLKRDKKICLFIED